jgi:hypothetical protein
VTANAATCSTETPRTLPTPKPHVADDIGQLQLSRVVAVVKVHEIRTLAELTMRIPRRLRW